MTGRGWQGADKVNVDVVESLRDGCKSAGRRLSVQNHLGGLTDGVGASPEADVLVDTLPDEM